MQQLYVSLESMSELLTRLSALHQANQISDDQFEKVDVIHYEIENKIWHLLKSLEEKKSSGDWIDKVSEDIADFNAH